MRLMRSLPITSWATVPTADTSAFSRVDHMTRSAFRNRGSRRRLRQIRIDRKSARKLWIAAIALFVFMFWFVSWLASHIPAH